MKANITVGSTPANPKKGTGNLAIVSFKVIGDNGTSQIGFGPATAVAAIGEGNTSVVIAKTPSTFTIREVILGDLDNNHKVDIDDYNLMVTHFNKTGAAGFVTADINRNGKVDIFDYNELIGNFGKSN
jgi:hypothetical protein